LFYDAFFSIYRKRPERPIIAKPDNPTNSLTIENDSASSQVKKTTSDKPELRNQKRLRLLQSWYRDLCAKNDDDIGRINETIDRLTNKQIIGELTSIARPDEKYIWTNGAERWLKDNGASVWGFKKTQGGKPKKPK
jgi:hypothetical protein